MNQENTDKLKPGSGYMVISSNLISENKEIVDKIIEYWVKNSELLTLYDLKVKFFHSLEEIEIELLLNSLTQFGGVKLETKKVDGERFFRLEVSEDSVFRDENYIQRFSGNLTRDELSAIVNKAQENANRDSKQFIIDQIEKEMLPLYTPSEYVEVLKNERNKYLEILKRHYYQINYPKEMIDRLHQMSLMEKKIRVEYGVIFFGKVTEEQALLSGLQNAYYYKLFVDCLNDKINQLEKPSKPKSQTEQTGFHLGFSEPQLEALHQALMDKGYLSKETNLAHFKNAFNSKELIDFEPLKWIDKSTTRPQLPNAQTLYEFLFLLGIKDDLNLYQKIKNVFVPIKDFKNKNPHNATGDTVRKKELKAIFQTLNLI